MNKQNVRTPAEALAYITDCTLATVCDMALRKSRPKGEYRRQKAIAQKAIDWMDEMGVDYTGTRAVEVSRTGSVDEWAKGFELEAGT